MFDCFIFDVDGTLLDSREAMLAALGRLIFEQRGFRPPRGELEAQFGQAGHLTLAGYGIVNLGEALSLWGSYMDEGEVEITLFEGMAETLAALKAAGKYLGIITSRRREDLDVDLRRLGLDRLIDRIICSGDTPKHKPHPDPLYRFFEGSPVSRERSLYIGDTEFDALCASSSGTAFGLAVWGGVDEAASALPSLRRFTSPRELLELL